MYSQWIPPIGVGAIKIKKQGRTAAYASDRLACKSFDRVTWFVFDWHTGIVEAIYFSEANVHGFIVAEHHAKSHVNRSEPFNPFELDTIP